MWKSDGHKYPAALWLSSLAQRKQEFVVVGCKQEAPLWPCMEGDLTEGWSCECGTPMAQAAAF